MVLYLLIPETKASVILDKVKWWFDREGGSDNFDSVKSIARAAICEYLANEQGFTFYSSKAQRLPARAVFPAFPYTLEITAPEDW